MELFEELFMRSFKRIFLWRTSTFIKKNVKIASFVLICVLDLSKSLFSLFYNGRKTLQKQRNRRNRTSTKWNWNPCVNIVDVLCVLFISNSQTEIGLKFFFFLFFHYMDLRECNVQKITNE